MSRRFTAGTGLTMTAALGVAGTAQAEDIRVTNLNDSGAGSLRQAITEANSDVDADRILFKSKLSGTIELSGTFALEIRDGDLEIVGPGARRLEITRPGDGESLFSIFTTGAVTSLDVTISGLALTNTDTNYNGGAIAAYSNTGPTDLTLSRVTISGNTATGEGGGSYGSGGGISARSILGEGSLTIDSSTISGNSGQPSMLGGGVYTENVDLSIRNSTISGNSGVHDGGGVYVLADGFAPSFAVRSSTVTGNEATGGAAGGGLSEGSVVPASTLRGSIVAGNTDGDGSSPDIDDGPWNVSFSIIGDSSGAGINDGGGNLLDVDPLLGALANNGGPTDTHALAPESQAIDNGPADAPSSDQRGAPRKRGPEIGAYELVKCAGVVVNRVGTEGKDKLKGTKGKDGILGLGGKDKLTGKKKKDGICGAAGRDKLKGGPGKDKLKGGPGKDILKGGPGKDKLRGGPGKDKETQ